MGRPSKINGMFSRGNCQEHFPLGKEQAVVLAEQLKQEPLDVIVCSDLARSYDTAKVVAGYHGKQPQPTPLLQEMDWEYIPAKRWRM